jgi:hypothetical protein
MARHYHVWTLLRMQGLLNEHNDSGLQSCLMVKKLNTHR